MSVGPRPRVTAVNAPFWDGCNRRVLMLQRCIASDCGRSVFYPRVCCPFCGGGDLAWEQASGHGTIRTLTRVHRPGHNAFLADAPYIFAAVSLREGPILYGRLRSEAPDLATLVGRTVLTEFHPDLADQCLPSFSLIENRDAE